MRTQILILTIAAFSSVSYAEQQYTIHTTCKARVSSETVVSFQSWGDFDTEKETDQNILLSAKGKITPGAAPGADSLIGVEGNPYVFHSRTDEDQILSDGKGWIEYSFAKISKPGKALYLGLERYYDSPCERRQKQKTQFKQPITFVGVDLKEVYIPEAKQSLSKKVKSGSLNLNFTCEKIVYKNNLSEACR